MLPASRGVCPSDVVEHRNRENLKLNLVAAPLHIVSGEECEQGADRADYRAENNHPKGRRDYGDVCHERNRDGQKNEKVTADVSFAD